MMNLKSKFYHKWLRNYKVKIFTLCSALFLWFYVVTDNRYEHVIQVPLRLQNQPADWILTYPVPSKIKVLFRGTGKNLLSLGYRNKWVELDIKKSTRAAKIPITIDMIKGIPSGTGIIPGRIVEPDSIDIQFDHFASKKVPIHSNITIDLMDGYVQVGDIQFEPDSLIISGPRVFVQKINEIKTEEVGFQDVLKKVDGKIDLIVPEWETVNCSINTARYTVDVQRIGEKLFRDIPVTVTGLPRGLNVMVVPSTLSLKLQGGVRILSNVSKDELIATIDYGSRRRYEGKQIPATIEVPDALSFTDVKPKFFELIIEQ